MAGPTHLQRHTPIQMLFIFLPEYNLGVFRGCFYNESPGLLLAQGYQAFNSSAVASEWPLNHDPFLKEWFAATRPYHDTHHRKPLWTFPPECLNIGAGVFGTMVHNFDSKAPDQLTVIAGARPELDWVLVRLIGRLNESGLVPLWLIEISDTNIKITGTGTDRIPSDTSRPPYCWFLRLIRKERRTRRVRLAWSGSKAGAARKEGWSAQYARNSTADFVASTNGGAVIFESRPLWSILTSMKPKSVIFLLTAENI
jgi:hypothetical protein